MWLRTLLCSRFYKYTGSSNAHCIDMSHSLRIGGPKCIVFRRWFMWWSWWSFHQEDCLTVETKGRRMKRRYCQSSQQCQLPNPNLTLTPLTNYDIYSDLNVQAQGKLSALAMRLTTRNSSYWSSSERLGQLFISYKLCGKVVENRRRDIEAAALLGILFITVNYKFISSKICETIKWAPLLSVFLVVCIAYSTQQSSNSVLFKCLTISPNAGLWIIRYFCLVRQRIPTDIIYYSLLKATMITKFEER